MTQFIEFIGNAWTEVRRVPDRTPPLARPPLSVGYRFYERQEAGAMLGPIKDTSPSVYWGDRLSLDEVEHRFFKRRQFIADMRLHNFNFACFTIEGDLVTIADDDVVEPVPPPVEDE